MVVARSDLENAVNIFILDANPLTAAQYLCDKHIVKMPVETAQMMAASLRGHGATDSDMPLTKSGTPYRGGYMNHPCTRWAGTCKRNYFWLGLHGIALCMEYTFRYNKKHACQEAIEHMMDLRDHIPGNYLRSPFVLAMPDEYKERDAVRAYRKYYVGEKSDIAEWNKGRDAPKWFTRSR